MEERKCATRSLVLAVIGLGLSIADAIDNWTDLVRLALCLGWLTLLVWWWIRTERLSTWGLALGWVVMIAPVVLVVYSDETWSSPGMHATVALIGSGIFPVNDTLPNRRARRGTAAREARLREEQAQHDGSQPPHE